MDSRYSAIELRQQHENALLAGDVTTAINLLLQAAARYEEDGNRGLAEFTLQRAMQLDAQPRT